MPKKYEYLSPLGENLRELPTPLPELFFDKRCMHTIGCELPNLLEDPQPVVVVKIKKRWGKGADSNYNIWLADGTTAFDIHTYLLLVECK